MSKGNTFENDLLLYLFNGTAISGLGSSVYVSLHTADPGEGGNQETSECNYGSYARVALNRTTDWDVTSSDASPAAAIVFPGSTGDFDNQTATHAAVGTAATGPGKILYKGPIDPTIVVTFSVIPGLLTTSTITED